MDDQVAFEVCNILDDEGNIVEKSLCCITIQSNLQNQEQYQIY